MPETNTPENGPNPSIFIEYLTYAIGATAVIGGGELVIKFVHDLASDQASWETPYAGVALFSSGVTIITGMIRGRNSRAAEAQNEQTN